jgi:hypothetical protein
LIATARYSVIASLLLAGCSSPEAQEDRAILTAIDVLRESSPDDATKRRELIDALAKRPATNPLAIEARDKCAEAYRYMLEGQIGTQKVKTALARPAEKPTNLAEELAAAEKSILKSEPAMRACQKATAELGMKRR